MISWTSHIYTGKSIKWKKDKVIASINNKKVTFGVYCIVFASHPDNLFDIMDANELLFPHYEKMQIHIVGLARGKKEAFELAQRMLMEVYKKTGKFNVRTFFT
jgi:hypothetical protein